MIFSGDFWKKSVIISLRLLRGPENLNCFAAAHLTAESMAARWAFNLLFFLGFYGNMLIYSTFSLKGNGTWIAICVSRGRSLRYSKQGLILLYRTLLQSPAATAPPVGSLIFSVFLRAKKMPQIDYGKNENIMQTIPQSSSMTAPFTQWSLLFTRYFQIKTYFLQIILWKYSHTVHLS